MNKDRIEGAAKRDTGSFKQAAGKATGNRTLQAKGAAGETVGRVQNAAGKVEDRAGRSR